MAEIFTLLLVWVSEHQALNNIKKIEKDLLNKHPQERNAWHQTDITFLIYKKYNNENNN